MRLRTIIAGALAPLAIAAAAVTAAPGAAQPARAWTWDPHVTVTGKVTGYAPGPIQVITVRGNLNGEIRTWSSGLTSAQPTYRLSFDNVPKGGGWAWVVVHSSVLRDYGVWVHVYRPGWGTTENANI